LGGWGRGGGTTKVTALHSSGARAEVAGTTALKPEPQGKLSPTEQLEAAAHSHVHAKAAAAEKRAEAKAKGYEGEACGECGNFTLVRNGTCMKCDTCGSTTGCS
jgi:ribonucleoside-diphosphate reductase alpha chain